MCILNYQSLTESYFTNLFNTCWAHGHTNMSIILLVSLQWRKCKGVWLSLVIFTNIWGYQLSWNMVGLPFFTFFNKRCGHVICFGPWNVRTVCYLQAGDLRAWTWFATPSFWEFSDHGALKWIPSVRRLWMLT